VPKDIKWGTAQDKLTEDNKPIYIWIVGTVASCHLHEDQGNPKDVSVDVKPFFSSSVGSAKELLKSYGQPAQSLGCNQRDVITVARSMASRSDPSMARPFTSVFDAREGYDNTIKSDHAKRIPSKEIMEDDVVLVEAFLSRTPAKPSLPVTTEPQTQLPSTGERPKSPTRKGRPQSPATKGRSQPPTTEGGPQSSTEEGRPQSGTTEGPSQSTPGPSVSSSEQEYSVSFKLVDIILLAKGNGPKGDPVVPKENPAELKENLADSKTGKPLSTTRRLSQRIKIFIPKGKPAPKNPGDTSSNEGVAQPKEGVAPPKSP